MSGSGQSSSSAQATWSEVFDREHRAAVSVLAGGIALFAINTYLTSATLPSAVADIGGQHLYAWVMTVFLLTSVLSSMLVTRALAQWGARRAYLIAYGVFGIGSLGCALTPDMAIMLVSRAIQGLGGGLLTGLAFTVIRVALPSRLWVRAVGLTSGMWGVGNVIGPTIGGLFGQVGFWRGSFWLLVVATALIAALAVRALPGRGSTGRATEPIPVASLILVVAATAVVSIASVLTSVPVMAILLAVSLLVLAGFVVVDRRRVTGLLPRLSYRVGNPLKWIYLSIVVLSVGSTSEAFIPLFGQRIAGMDPLPAGLLGAAISWGWTVGQLSSSTWAHGRRAGMARVAGPAVLAAGLTVYGALQSSAATPAIIGWFAALFVAGTGIGMAFPHIATAAMTITTDEAEVARASAGINTVQMVANTFGSALAGLLVSLGASVPAAATSTVSSAHFLLFGYATLSAVGVGIALLSLRSPITGDPGGPPQPDGSRSDGYDRPHIA